MCTYKKMNMLNSKTAYTNFLVEATFTCTDMKYIQKEQTNVASYPCVIQVWLLYFYLDEKKCTVHGGDKFKEENVYVNPISIFCILAFSEYFAVKSSIAKERNKLHFMYNIFNIFILLLTIHNKMTH